MSGTRKPLHLRLHAAQRMLNAKHYDLVTGPALDRITTVSNTGPFLRLDWQGYPITEENQ